MGIKENLTALRTKIATAAKRSGRSPEEIKLVAVIKNIPDELVREAIRAGLADFGENRVQEAKKRNAFLRAAGPNISVQMIGHLQTNKVGQALDMFDIIQSVDSERLLEEINRRALKPVPILIEVNTSGETSKFGIEPEKTVALARFASTFEKIKLQGLMTIGPVVDDPEKARLSFAHLRELKEKIDKLVLPNVAMKHLSMGMSGDFEIAIEEGSNLVRLGRAIFKEE